MRNEDIIVKNLIKSYSENIGFPVYSADELDKLYGTLGIDPKSTHRSIFDIESLSHHPQSEVVKLVKMMNITKNDLVLDAGCGNGGPTRLIAKLCGCKIKAFDINPTQIKKGADCDRLEGVDHLIEREAKDVHTIDYPAESFDKIFHNESICHWMNKKAAVAGLYNALKEGGTMGFHDWPQGDKGDLNAAGGDFPGTYAEGVWFQDSIQETRKLLKEAGFVILHSEDLTDRIDRSLCARLRELRMSKLFTKGTSEEYFRKTERYFKVMIDTHYDYLRYARFVCKKD
jgi:cyclopropane fatty-acyl-phospholipid synthase-like methyltransferase